MDNDDINFTRTISDIISLTIISHRYENGENLRVLSAMTLCTEKFLNSKDINAFSLTYLLLWEKATKSHRAYYYEKMIKQIDS
jgi:hypothetical protein